MEPIGGPPSETVGGANRMTVEHEDIHANQNGPSNLAFRSASLLLLGLVGLWLSAWLSPLGFASGLVVAILGVRELRRGPKGGSTARSTTIVGIVVGGLGMVVAALNMSALWSWVANV